MQLLLILGIIFAIASVTFALQNNAPVAVVFASWKYDSSLAVVVLVALAFGALIAGLVSTPSVIKGQWRGTRLRRQVAILEDEKAALELRIRDLESAMAQKSLPPLPAPEPVAPYVGLRDIILAQEQGKPT
jgi:uncharacterized integral membrane protein